MRQTHPAGEKQFVDFAGNYRAGVRRVHRGGAGRQDLRRGPGGIELHLRPSPVQRGIARLDRRPFRLNHWARVPKAVSRQGPRPSAASPPSRTTVTVEQKRDILVSCLYVATFMAQDRPASLPVENSSWRVVRLDARRRSIDIVIVVHFTPEVEGPNPRTRSTGSMRRFSAAVSSTRMFRFTGEPGSQAASLRTNLSPAKKRAARLSGPKDVFDGDNAGPGRRRLVVTISGRARQLVGRRHRPTEPWAASGATRRGRSQESRCGGVLGRPYVPTSSAPWSLLACRSFGLTFCFSFRHFG
jgi:hypothetical protein